MYADAAAHQFGLTSIAAAGYCIDSYPNAFAAPINNPHHTQLCEQSQKVERLQPGYSNYMSLRIPPYSGTFADSPVVGRAVRNVFVHPNDPAHCS